MINMTSGILDRTRMMSNILMILLVAGNMYFSIQYIENIRQNDAIDALTQDNINTRIQAARVLSLFINTVLNTENKVIPFDDRVKLETDTRLLRDAALTAQWEKFQSSQDNLKQSQANAIKFMSMLTIKMIP